MRNNLLNIIEKRKLGIHSGIPSFCCSNKIVIEAILERAKKYDDYVLIEATSNQVNQYGGYTEMTPMEFKKYTYKIATRVGFNKDKIILGGDHIGPLPWANLPAKEAMEKAKHLVKLCVLAGYKKIHLDTSMRLGDDDPNEKLSADVIAERGVLLFNECEKTYNEMLKKNPNEVKPVFVIGSEVPIPGGSKDKVNNDITDAEDFENTLLAYKRKFNEYKINHCWKDIIAVVVQTGVEFGENEINEYDSKKAEHLCNKLKQYPDIVFEGHSTDYQPPQKLRQMVRDGIAIIKVGPALTYALRQALFALCFIENEMIENVNSRSNFINVLDDIMRGDDKYWKQYYTGNNLNIKLARKYSYSDRCRYYLINNSVKKSIEKLFNNIDHLNIPMGLFAQFLPNQYVKIRDGILPTKSIDIVKDVISSVVNDYYSAVNLKYVINEEL